MAASGRRSIRRGRLLTVLVPVLVCAGYAGWQATMTRSVTIRLDPAGYELTYTMAWGMGMQEKFSLSKVGSLFGGTSSEWVEIWEKPYRSGLSVYRTRDGSRYYLGTLYKFFIFETSSDRLSSHCDPRQYPPLNDLGKQLDFYRSHEALENADPGGRSLHAYVEANEVTGAANMAPLASRYYEGLDYIGRFGLVRADGRGNEVRFVPAGPANEPRNSLVSQCG